MASKVLTGHNVSSSLRPKIREFDIILAEGYLASFPILDFGDTFFPFHLFERMYCILGKMTIKVQSFLVGDFELFLHPSPVSFWLESQFFSSLKNGYITLKSLASLDLEPDIK